MLSQKPLMKLKTYPPCHEQQEKFCPVSPAISPLTELSTALVSFLVCAGREQEEQMGRLRHLTRMRRGTCSQIHK